MAAGLVALAGQAVPTCGPLVLILLAAAVFTFLLMRQKTFNEGRRKALKMGLDTAWNLWAFLGVGTLFVSFAGGVRLEAFLGRLTPGWLSVVFVAACTVAAARFSLSLAEMLLLRWSSPVHTPAGK